MKHINPELYQGFIIEGRGWSTKLSSFSLVMNIWKDQTFGNLIGVKLDGEQELLDTKE